MNWDPFNLVQDAALDCFSCKRVPGETRPDLDGSVLVDQNAWMDIGCAVCHQPIDDSYAVEVSFWDQELQQYEPVEHVNELCAKCHEGDHGFEVIMEQAVSPAHNLWDCTTCHGNHGAPASCTDCHDPLASSGAIEHIRHPNVNCTACHDAGNLDIWKEGDPSSLHYSKFITIRFAHALTSWPSHNLTKTVDCTRCHHPTREYGPLLVPEISCEACHVDGASLFWCDFFPRDKDPNAITHP